MATLITAKDRVYIKGNTEKKNVHRVSMYTYFVSF